MSGGEPVRPLTKLASGSADVATSGVACLDCPYDGDVAAGSRSVRCQRCRKEHQRGKAADAQWDKRQRERLFREQRSGRRDDVAERRVRPRVRTPSWDVDGRPLQLPIALPNRHEQTLRQALASLEWATENVRAALKTFHQ